MSPMTTWSAAARAGGDAYKLRSAQSPAIVGLSMLVVPLLNVDSNAQKLLQQPHMRGELGLPELLDDPSVLHDVKPVCQGSRETEVLFDQHHCKSFRAEAANDVAELLHDHRREAL